MLGGKARGNAGCLASRQATSAGRGVSTRGYAGSDSTTIGVVVGANVPPEGSTVTPTESSAESPDARTGAVAPRPGAGPGGPAGPGLTGGTRPGGRTPGDPMDHRSE